MSDPETKDFGKEIIPQAVGNKYSKLYQYEGYWTNMVILTPSLKQILG
jgi:glucose-1-phosphate adenylyltransferase